MAGRELGRQWHRRFLKKFPEIQPLKGTKLNPKCAKHFNEAIINNYFDQLECLHACFPGGIPPQHIWNMDEKGIQMGGGQKNSRRKYLFLKHKKQKYHIQSDNLELVTVIECISAAGKLFPLPSVFRKALCLIYADWVMTSREGKHLCYNCTFVAVC